MRCEIAASTVFRHWPRCEFFVASCALLHDASKLCVGEIQNEWTTRDPQTPETSTSLPDQNPPNKKNNTVQPPRLPTSPNLLLSRQPNPPPAFHPLSPSHSTPPPPSQPLRHAHRHPTLFNTFSDTPSAPSLPSSPPRQSVEFSVFETVTRPCAVTFPSQSELCRL